jgi:hypothetical protein
MWILAYTRSYFFPSQTLHVVDTIAFFPLFEHDLVEKALFPHEFLTLHKIIMPESSLLKSHVSMLDLMLILSKQ